jgi:hypothetical protein
LLSSNRTVYNWPIVYNTLMRKSTLPILLRKFSSPYDNLETDIEISPVIWGSTLMQKNVYRKRFIFTGKKISSLAFFTTSLELSRGPPVKYQKKWSKNRFFFEKNKKILRLNMTRKTFLQDGSKTSILIFNFWNFKSS